MRLAPDREDWKAISEARRGLCEALVFIENRRHKKLFRRLGDNTPDPPVTACRGCAVVQADRTDRWGTQKPGRLHLDACPARTVLQAIEATDAWMQNWTGLEGAVAQATEDALLAAVEIPHTTRGARQAYKLNRLLRRGQELGA